MDSLLNWLIEQAATVVVLGVVLWYTARELRRERVRNKEVTQEFLEFMILLEKRNGANEVKDDLHKKELVKNQEAILKILRNG